MNNPGSLDFKNGKKSNQVASQSEKILMNTDAFR